MRVTVMVVVATAVILILWLAASRTTQVPTVPTPVEGTPDARADVHPVGNLQSRGFNSRDV